jgi:hypothetical protein
MLTSELLGSVVLLLKLGLNSLHLQALRSVFGLQASLLHLGDLRVRQEPHECGYPI